MFASNMLCLIEVSAGIERLNAIGPCRGWQVAEGEYALEFEEPSYTEVVNAAKGERRIAVLKVALDVESEVGPLASN